MIRLMGAGAGLLLIVGLSSCCTEQTVTFYRGATAEAPQLPSRVGARLKEGQIQMAAELNPVLFSGVKTFENRNDSAPAMWIPRLQFGGHIYQAVSDTIELGMQVRGSKAEWASPTTVQALELELEGKYVMQWGVGIRSNLSHPDDPLQVSFLGELNLVFREELIKETSYCSEWSDSWSTSCYALSTDLAEEGDKEVGSNLTAGFNAAWEVLPHLHVLGLAALAIRGTNSYSDTVTYNPQEESHPDGRDWDPTPILHMGAGLEFRLRPFVANALVHYPMSPVTALQYGPALSASTGIFF